MKNLLLSFLIAVSSALFGQTPMSGTYTIGGTNPDFNSISRALDTLNINGVNDTVIFDIRNGNYTHYLFNVSNFFNYPVIFRSQSGVNTSVVVKMSTIFTARNYQFHNITIVPERNSSTNYSPKGLEITQSSDIVFNGCRILGLSSTAHRNGLTMRASRGVDILNCTFLNLEHAIVYTAVTYFGSNRHYNDHYISNNTFDNCDIAVKLEGEFRDKIEIGGNRMINCDRGIDIDNRPEEINRLVIHGNHMTGITDYGIYSNDGRNYNFGGVKIYNNMIQGGKAGSITSSGPNGTITINTLVSIKLEGMEDADIYHNSTTGAIELWDCMNARIYNNIVSTAAAPALMIDHQTTYTSDHNNFRRGNSGILVMISFNYYNSLTAFQNATSHDANSVSVNPLFNSGTDLHASSPYLKQMGIAVPWITKDFDDQNRDPLTPDIGADEFSNDTTLPAVAAFWDDCAGTLKIQFTDNSVRPGGYEWIFNNTDTSTIANPIYTFPAPGTYPVRLKVFDRRGNGFDVITRQITVRNYARISQRGIDTLFISPNYSGYQWRLNGGVIPNANSHEYKALFTANYSVDYIDGSGCAMTSDTVYLLVTGQNELANTLEGKLFPNPTSNQLNIELPYNQNGVTYAIRLIGLDGKVLLDERHSKENIQLDMVRIPKGMYFIEISDGEKRLIEKIQKL